MCVYIYIYIYILHGLSLRTGVDIRIDFPHAAFTTASHVVQTFVSAATTPNLPTNIVEFTGFDSSIILIQRGGIPRFIGDFPESLSQAMLVGVMLVGGLGVTCPHLHASPPQAPCITFRA